MKRCPFCGTKNKTNAQFCFQCGEKFCIVDVRSKPDADLRDRDSFFRKEKINDAAEKIGVGLWSFLTSAFSWLSRNAFVPLGRAALRGANAGIGRAFAPSETWNPTRPPNFLYWALVQTLITRLPFSTVGVVYAILAKSARSDGKYDAAVKNAERARTWLFVDLCAWFVFALLRRS